MSFERVSKGATAMAVEASFQAFLNCYLREVDSGTWFSALSWQCASSVELCNDEVQVVELELRDMKLTLAIGVAYRSIAGRHRLTEVYGRHCLGTAWQHIDKFSVQLLLIEALYARHPVSEQRLELVGRVVESHQVMAAYLTDWLRRANEDSLRWTEGSFIETEQMVILGHWLHPTPKSRQGIQTWQHAHYAPELASHFSLHFFAAKRALVQQASLYEPAEMITRRMATRGLEEARIAQLAVLLGEERCLLPVHPLQAHWLQHQDWVRALLASGELVDLGQLGPLFTPTSSVRTVYCETEDFMLKLSIPVKITNSLRINLKSELGDSIWISKLLRSCGLEAFFPLEPILDPAYITLALREREETGFEVVFRQNPFRSVARQAKATVYSIAALVQDPLPGREKSRLCELVSLFAAREELSTDQASRVWFDAYLRCAIEPVLRAYDCYGIALEAHQQNSLLEMDASGLPVRAYYRDIQGLAIAEKYRERTLACVPELALQPKVFEEDELVRNGLGYYLFFNQLCAMIHRFGSEGLLSEDVALELVRMKLRLLSDDMVELGVDIVDMFLTQKWIPCKANLLTRIADLDELQAANELAVYGTVNNPFAANLPINSVEMRGWQSEVRREIG